MDTLGTAIARDGYALLPGVFTPAEVDALNAALASALQPRSAATAVRSDADTVYAARNILSLWPGAATVWQRPPLLPVLAAILGPGCGLVRTLYFDKPPERTWALPWHQDLTIAVQDHRLPSSQFTKPTRKAGVPHVEAPAAVLERMLFARIHLDEVTAENGPLKVIPGSHTHGKGVTLNAPPATILAQAGDVLLIRPLVVHASGKSQPDTQRHRRILHLEFAADRALPDGYAWHEFIASRADGCRCH